MEDNDQDDLVQIVDENYEIRRHSLGAAPGSLMVHPDATPSKLRVIAYGPDGFEESELASVDDIDAYQQKWPIVWMSVEGLGSAQVFRSIMRRFGFSTLVMEDALSVHSRPKTEVYEDYVFTVVRELVLDKFIGVDQVSIFWGPDFVVSFHEKDAANFEKLADRIRRGTGRVRKKGADYLAYAILDLVADQFFQALEDLGSRIEELEVDIFESPDEHSISELHRIRHQLLVARRSIRPMRQVISKLIQEESDLVTADTQEYLGDCYDHVVEALELEETYRELMSGLIDVYMTMSSQRVNDVVRILTLVSTIFIPLTFIAGVYGMNFNPDVSPLNMPELNAYYGYPLVLAFMAAIGVVLGLLFWHKGWFRIREPESPFREDA